MVYTDRERRILDNVLEFESQIQPLNSCCDRNSDDHPENCMLNYDTWDCDSKIQAGNWDLYCLVLKKRSNFRLNCKIDDTWYFKTYVYDCGCDDVDDTLVDKKNEFGHLMFKKIKRLLEAR